MFAGGSVRVSHNSCIVAINLHIYTQNRVDWRRFVSLKASSKYIKIILKKNRKFANYTKHSMLNNLRICGLIIYGNENVYLIAFTNSPILATPLSVKFLIKALPIIAPLANCVAWLKVSLLLIPKPMIWGFFRFISAMRLK